jgi:hypothetical protein
MFFKYESVKEWNWPVIKGRDRTWVIDRLTAQGNAVNHVGRLNTEDFMIENNFLHVGHSL